MHDPHAHVQNVCFLFRSTMCPLSSRMCGRFDLICQPLQEAATSLTACNTHGRGDSYSHTAAFPQPADQTGGFPVRDLCQRSRSEVINKKEPHFFDGGIFYTFYPKHQKVSCLPTVKSPLKVLESRSSSRRSEILCKCADRQTERLQYPRRGVGGQLTAGIQAPGSDLCSVFFQSGVT